MRHCKSALIFSLFIFTCFNSFSQDEKRYSSKEEDAYYARRRNSFTHKDFVPVSIEKAKNNPYEYVKISNVEHPAIYTPQRYEYKGLDSLMKASLSEKVGIINKLSVIKDEKLGDKWAIIYYDLQYDDFIDFRNGYWLALSYDNGKTWKQYYTGLSENFYYHFKWDSKLPLWKNSETLQIESAILRQNSRGEHPFPPTFEPIQDSISVELNISKIIQDSDNDGLTDIVEKKLMLDPHNSDTDGDGITDSEDKNPRFKSVKTPKSILYETLIENVHMDGKDEMEINLSNPPIYVNSKLDSLNDDFGSVKVLVTDDKDLQGINLCARTMIILTTKEYEEYKLKYPSPLAEKDLTPMFKCDKGKNRYKIDIFDSTSSWTYLIQRTPKGWRIRLISLMTS